VRRTPLFLAAGACLVVAVVLAALRVGEEPGALSGRQALVLGIVQGLTEFLPVSSSAHLVIVPWLFGWPDPGLTFDVALHVGTLAALLIYFRSDWLYLTMSAFRLLKGDTDDPDGRVALYIILATIPGALAGLLFEDLADRLSSPTVVATALIVLALALRAAELSGRREIDLGTMTVLDALAIGAAQTLAIVPGVSRSGITITAGLLRGMTRKAAAQYSFLLSAPIIAGAVAKKLFDIFAEGLPPDQEVPFAAGTIVSALFGFITMAALLRYLQTRSTFIFVYYRVALGILVLMSAYFSSLP